MPDLKFLHAREFTDIEDVGLTVWNALQDAKLNDLALQVLDAILMHEHYTSLLDNDPGKRSEAEKQQKENLRIAAEAAIQRGRDALAAQAPTLGVLKLPVIDEHPNHD